MSYAKKVISYLSKIFNYVGTVSLFALTLLVCAHILMRTFFHRPIGSTYECVGLLTALVSALSISSTELSGGHISVGILVDRFSERTRALIDIPIKCISIGIFSMLAWYSFGYARELWSAREVSQTMGISFSPFVFLVAICAILMCLALFVGLFKSVERVVEKK
jgi:TRAP-type C4-dicarboxylate transport system permease small subunit